MHTEAIDFTADEALALAQALSNAAVVLTSRRPVGCALALAVAPAEKLQSRLYGRAQLPPTRRRRTPMRVPFDQHLAAYLLLRETQVGGSFFYLSALGKLQEHALNLEHMATIPRNLLPHASLVLRT